MLVNLLYGYTSKILNQVITQTAKFDIRPVTSPADNQIFLDIPAQIYAKEPYWVSPIPSSIAKQFTPANPFLNYGKLQQFIALSQENSQPLGRIVAAVNQRLIDREAQNIGLFGFFECIQDFTVAQALLNTACKWLREQGMIIGRGPIDLSTHNNCLFLVDGFDSPPMVMMPYNPAYYPEFMERDNWHKAKDAYAYDFPLDKPLPPEFEKAYRIACKSGVKFRPIATKGEAFERDAKSIYQLFNRAFAPNWSSTPRSEAEFLEEAKDLRDLIDPDVFPVAEYNGEMIGFWMGLPDYNIPLKQVNGKLNWLGILKFLWYRRQIDRGRVIAICSLPEYRRKMVPLALIYLGMQGGKQKGKPYKRAELSWVFEDNFPSRKLIEAAGGKIYKTYRIYEKVL
ncbi:GNAT family N-acetyltransferase [Dendronalium phyllosphericum]|uniref:GNAT family N-acetyltransferase n=1 Tax=Dendronalium phyllosphericum TaxID=2840445 RepID=UPI001CEC68AB